MAPMAKRTKASEAAAALGRLRWKGLTAEDRAAAAGAAAASRWSTMTPEERSAEMKRRRRLGLKKR